MIESINGSRPFASLLATTYDLTQVARNMDLEASRPIVKSEFIAVVLAGFGRE